MIRLYLTYTVAALTLILGAVYVLLWFTRGMAVLTHRLLGVVGGM